LYDRAEEFPIPDEVDDRLRDMEKGTRLQVDAMVKAATALSGIRVEDDTDEARLVAALTVSQRSASRGRTVMT
jgi:hypothetical protein